MWNYVIFAAAILMLSMGVGEYISAKTKGIFGSILVLSLIYLIGYQVGIIPDTTPVDTGIIADCRKFRNFNDYYKSGYHDQSEAADK